MTIKTHKSSYPHIEWIDLENNGVLVECAIMKRDPNGNIYFFPLKFLDQIDKRRLHKIITNRNAPMYELWDLMSNVTLGNGVNALEFFHQFVRVITPSGKIINAGRGSVGAAEEGGIRSSDNPAVPFEPTATDGQALPTDDELAQAEAVLAKAGKVSRKAPAKKSARTTEGLQKGADDFT